MRGAAMNWGRSGMLLSIAAIGVLWTSFAATARPDAPLEMLAPVSPWNMDYGIESCRLMRAFGPQGSPVLLKLENFSLNDSPSLLVVGKRFSSESPFQKVRLRFGDAPTAEVEALAGSMGDAHTPMLIVRNVDLVPRPPAVFVVPADPEAERRVRTMMIQRVGGKAVALQLGPMDKPMAAMRSCIDSLVKAWGLDPAIQRSLSRQAIPLASPRSWVGDNDYPRQAIAEGESGLVHFRLMIDDSGKPTQCVIQSKTKPDEFAPTVCGLITRRARFQPALDSQGKPVPTYFASSVQFQMEH